MRGRLLCAFTRPNCGLPNTAFGGAKRGLFETLNTSVRNWRLSRSLSLVFLVSVISTCAVPWLRQPLKVSGAVPNAYVAGLEKTLLSSQRFGVGSETHAFWPFQLGRCPPPCEKVLLTVELTPNGPPEKALQIAPSCQPPSSFAAGPGRFL